MPDKAVPGKTGLDKAEPDKAELDKAGLDMVKLWTDPVARAAVGLDAADHPAGLVELDEPADGPEPALDA